MEVKLLLWFIVILVGFVLLLIGLCRYTLNLFIEMRKDYNKIIEIDEEKDKLQEQLKENYEKMIKNCEERINLYEKYFREESKEVY